MSHVSPLRITLLSSKLPEARAYTRQDLEAFSSLMSTTDRTLAQPKTSAPTTASSEKVTRPFSQTAVETPPTDVRTSSPSLRDLCRGSIDLFPRLSREDAVELEALAANGQITWGEINAALDAKMKQATVEGLLRDRRRLERKPQSWLDADAARDSAWEKYNAWTRAWTAGESEIRARYDEKSSGLFREDPGTGPAAMEKLLAQVKIKDDLDTDMQKELAELAQKLGPKPPMPSNAFYLPPWSTAFAWSRLTTTESEALEKLNATGFTGSANMERAINGLVGEITRTIVTWYEKEQQASLA
jgi:hypothetical protein